MLGTTTTATTAPAAPPSSDTVSAPTAAPTLQNTHQAVVRATQPLKPTAHTLRNGVSSAVCISPMSFTSLSQTIALISRDLGERAVGRMHIGSIDGNLLVAVRARGSSTALCGKKKRRDDSEDRAEAAVSALRTLVKTGDGDSSATHHKLDHIESAKSTLCNLLRNVRGPNDEDVFESVGVSMSSASTTTTTASTLSTRPKLIVAFRMSAGVAIPVESLKNNLGAAFRDGLFTTNAASLGPEYRLPLTSAGCVVEGTGQRSVLCFAAVPEPTVP